MTTEEAGGGSGGVTTQVREKGEEVVAKAQEQVQEKTEQARSQASERVRQEVDRRSTEFGDDGQSFAQALRQAAVQLEEQDKQAPARAAHNVADKIEQLSRYLRDSDADRILGDIENRARRQPWVAAGAGAVFGFLASRFVKASSGRRYEEQRGNGHRRSHPRQLEPGRSMSEYGDV